MVAMFSLRDFLHPLALFGFAGQFIFMARFLVQWYASERRGKSYVPTVFWWISIAGGLMLFVYAVLREDVVFTAGQLLGLAIYIRNLMLIYRRQSRIRARARRGFAVVVDSDLPDTDSAPVPPREG